MLQVESYYAGIRSLLWSVDVPYQPDSKFDIISLRWIWFMQLKTKTMSIYVFAIRKRLIRLIMWKLLLDRILFRARSISNRAQSPNSFIHAIKNEKKKKIGRKIRHFFTIIRLEPQNKIHTHTHTSKLLQWNETRHKSSEKEAKQKQTLEWMKRLDFGITLVAFLRVEFGREITFEITWSHFPCLLTLSRTDKQKLACSGKFKLPET